MRVCLRVRVREGRGEKERKRERESERERREREREKRTHLEVVERDLVKVLDKLDAPVESEKLNPALLLALVHSEHRRNVLSSDCPARARRSQRRRWV